MDVGQPAAGELVHLRPPLGQEGLVAEAADSPPRHRPHDDLRHLGILALAPLPRHRNPLTDAVLQGEPAGGLIGHWLAVDGEHHVALLDIHLGGVARPVGQYPVHPEPRSLVGRVIPQAEPARRVALQGGSRRREAHVARVQLAEHQVHDRRELAAVRGGHRRVPVLLPHRRPVHTVHGGVVVAPGHGLPRLLEDLQTLGPGVAVNRHAVVLGL